MPKPFSCHAKRCFPSHRRHCLVSPQSLSCMTERAFPCVGKGFSAPTDTWRTAPPHSLSRFCFVKIKSSHNCIFMQLTDRRKRLTYSRHPHAKRSPNMREPAQRHGYPHESHRRTASGATPLCPQHPTPQPHINKKPRCLRHRGMMLHTLTITHPWCCR